MPKVDGERVVADLKRLAEFGRYKTGVHRPTYSEVDVASRQWLAEQVSRGGARRLDRRHRQCLRPQYRRAAAAAGRLAQRDAALWRLARRRARRHLRARTGARLCRRSPMRRARHRCRRLGRRGRPLRQLSWQPLLYRRAAGGGNRPHQGPRRRHALARGIAARRVRRKEARRSGARPPCRLSRSAYRAGRHARYRRAAHRHRRVDCRHLELPRHGYRRAEPCRHHPHGAAQGRRGGDGAARHANPRPLPGDRRPAHGLDDRPHAASNRMRPRSSPAAPRCRSSSATPTPNI